MNLGVGLGGLTGGLIATVDNLTSFTVLFVLDGLTFLAYVGVLGLIHDPGRNRCARRVGGLVPRRLRDRLFLGLWALNFTFVAAGYSLLNLLPPFVRDHGDLNERQIGVVFFFNTITIVLAQLPLSRWIEGGEGCARSRSCRCSGPCVARDRRDRLLARGDDGVRLRDVLRDRLRDRRVLPRAGAPGARRRARDRAAARPLLRAALDVVGLGGTVGPAVGGLILAQAPFALWPLAAAVLVVASRERSRSSGSCRRSCNASARRTPAGPRARPARARTRRSRRTGRRVESPRYDRASGRSAQYRCRACLASGVAPAPV